MKGFKKYIIILGGTFIVLWFISIVIYWGVIGDYINGLYSSGVSLLVYIIVFLIVLLFIIGLKRG